MAIRIQLRNDLSTEWLYVNPILAQGEIGLETDTRKFKIGNGIDNWSELPYNVNDFQTFVETTNGLYTLENIGIGTNVISANNKLTVRGNVSVAGTATATKFVGDGSELTGIVKINQQLSSSQLVYPTFGSNIGVTTLGISSSVVYVPSTNRLGIGSTAPTTTLDVKGAITATTYYGDGYNLTNTGVGISVFGTPLDSSVKKVNLYGPGISTVTTSSGISSISFGASYLGVTTTYSGNWTYSFDPTYPFFAVLIVYVTLSKSCIITSIKSDYPSWMRIYNSDSALSNDANRLRNKDPQPGSGVIVEVATSSFNQTITLSPTPLLVSNNNPRSSIFPIRVASQSNLPINITINYIPLE